MYLQLLMAEAEAAENLRPIFAYSPFASTEKLLQQFERIKTTGTVIIIFTLRKDGSPILLLILSGLTLSTGTMLEFSFDEDRRDIRIRGDNQVAGTIGAAGRRFQRQRINQDPTTEIPLDYSLRVS